MIPTSTSPFTHLGAPGDTRARCGERGTKARVLCFTLTPDRVTCRACLAALMPSREVRRALTVTIELRPDHLPILERLAAIAGKDLAGNTGKVVSALLEAKIAELRAVLL